MIPSKYETAEAFKEQHVSYYKQQQGTETKKRKERSDKGTKRGLYKMKPRKRKERSDKGMKHCPKKKKQYTLPFKMKPLFK